MLAKPENFPSGPTSSRFVIYGLFDPRDGALRYIGKSINGMRRAGQHAKTADLKRHGRTHKTAWVKSLLRKKLRPVTRVLLEVGDKDLLYAEEQRLIAEYKAAGEDLTNATDGGPGRIGYHLSDETKEKLRKAARLQQQRSPTCHTAETKEKLRKLQQGRKHTDDARRNMAKAHGGRPFRVVETGQIFHSQSEAARVLGLQQTKIWAVLHKKPKRKSTGGLHFEFLEES